ncbi:GNAT family N-acetyltransferase [Motiliproteus sp.]|uniref:GNAT family N-acetyltransferase n=1 Tax=Motiliproteus sp. TaxID=1898955 RepID=UPI003BAA64B8
MEDQTIYIETQRLTIRPLTLTDLKPLCRILSDPQVMKHSLRGVCDEPATHRFIRWCQTSYAEQGFGPSALIDKASGELVGFCGVGVERVAERDEINLGYRLAQHFWNRGLATEAARAMIDDAFRHYPVDSIVAIIEPDHLASLRVAQKAGLHLDAKTDFHQRTVHLYRLTRHRWLQQNTASIRPTTPATD